MISGVIPDRNRDMMSIFRETFTVRNIRAVNVSQNVLLVMYDCLDFSVILVPERKDFISYQPIGNLGVTIFL